MTQSSADVVVVGGGIAGISAAYYLARAGIRSVVLERDSLGSHASGFAYGGLSPLGGAGIPGPLAPMSNEAVRLHRELARVLPAETGIDIEFRTRPALSLAFTDEEAAALRDGLEWRQRQPGYRVEWVAAADLKRFDARVSEEAIGGVYTEGTADLEPYRFVLALSHAAEKLGVGIQHGTAIGLKLDGGQVRGVTTTSGSIGCDRVVLAMGPWSADSAAWLGVSIPVRPLKGQIIRLRAPGPPLDISLGWQKNYAVTKPDGLLWAGTTEEEAGFDDAPTAEGRDKVMASLLKMAPAFEDAQLEQHTACLRPVSADEMLLLGQVPGCDGVYMATGAGRKGILLGPAMGSITAELIATGSSRMTLGAFDPGRFGKRPARP